MLSNAALCNTIQNLFPAELLLRLAEEVVQSMRREKGFKEQTDRHLSFSVANAKNRLK